MSPVSSSECALVELPNRRASARLTPDRRTPVLFIHFIRWAVPPLFLSLPLSSFSTSLGSLIAFWAALPVTPLFLPQPPSTVGVVGLLWGRKSCPTNAEPAQRAKPRIRLQNGSAQQIKPFKTPKAGLREDPPKQRLSCPTHAARCPTNDLRRNLGRPNRLFALRNPSEMIPRHPRGFSPAASTDRTDQSTKNGGKYQDKPRASRPRATIPEA